VLSVGYFTTLQILFVILLYSPGLVAVLAVLGLADVERFFVAPYFWDLMIVSSLRLLVCPRHTLRRPALGHDDQVLHGWRQLQE
jgi:hypothetical protein